MIAIRPAGPDDLAFLFRLTERLADFPVPPWRTRGMIARADDAVIRTALERPDPATLLVVATDGEGTPRGYLLATTRRDYFTGGPHGHVEILAVEPEVEGRGIGRALLDAADGWARSRGYDHLTLNVFAANERARAVYGRLGWEPELMTYRKALDREQR